MEKLTVILLSFQILIGLIELGVTLDKKFKWFVEKTLHVPEEDREP